MLKSFTAFALSSFGYFYTPSLCTNAEESKVDTSRNAISILTPETDAMVHGMVSFSQQNIASDCEIVAHIKNLKPNSTAGTYITNFGDFTGGKNTLGGTFDPRNVE